MGIVIKRMAVYHKIHKIHHPNSQATKKYVNGNNSPQPSTNLQECDAEVNDFTLFSIQR